MIYHKLICTNNLHKLIMIAQTQYNNVYIQLYTINVKSYSVHWDWISKAQAIAHSCQTTQGT